MPFLNAQYRCLSDEDLIKLVADGEQQAFEEIHRRYSRRLLYYFSRMLGGYTESAQDFLQDLFLKVLEEGCSFSSKWRFSTWVFTLAHNMCCNEYRRLEVRKRKAEAVIDMTELIGRKACESPEESVDRKFFRDALLRELGQLDRVRRSTFLLRFQENLSIEDISAILGCPDGTVKSRLHYMTRQLAERLTDFNPYLDVGELA